MIIFWLKQSVDLDDLLFWDDYLGRSQSISDDTVSPIVDFPILCSYGIAGTLGWILSSRIKPFNGMDFRYSRTQRSRDIKLYLILWFIWSCIWWCWFLKRSFNGREFRHSCPQMFRVIKLHFICSFIWCIWCFISWFWLWFSLQVFG